MLKELRERLAKLAKDMRSMHEAAEAEDRGFTPEERQSWEAMTAEYEGIEARIAAAERLEQIDNTPEGPDATPDYRDNEGDDDAGAPRTALEMRGTAEYDAAYDVFLRGTRPLEREERELLIRNQAEMEVRAQGIATDAAGGYTVPEGFAGRITESMQDFSGLYGATGRGNGPTLLRTASGNTIPFPTNDDTANSGDIIAENTQVPEQDTVFGQRTLGAYMFTSNLIRVSLQLLQDEAVNLQGYLGRLLGKRLGRGVAPYLANGTGTAQPTGLATAAKASGIGASAGTGWTYQLLVDLEHALDPAYRGSASYVFNDNSLKALKLLLDANNRPLWLPGDGASMADNAQGPTVNGYSYVIDQSFTDFANGNAYAAFGDLSEFIIREVLGINLFRFNERYMDFLQIGWMGYARWDSNLIDTEAVVKDTAVL